MRTIEDLRQKQELPLSIKIRLTMERIRQWVNEYGENHVYVSFSGGKDSTVLLHIVHCLCGYKNIKVVFVDVPTQYPELKEFAQLYDNIVILKPKISFMKICDKYGFPLISKDVALKLSRIYANPETCKYLKYFDGSQKGKSLFDCSKYKFMIKSPFKVSAQCCVIMKEEPLNNYSKENSQYPITAQMACESTNRKVNWIKHGCNMFDVRNPISNPMSFWTENDVLQYIADNHIEICSVYGKVILDHETNKYKTTGCKRTGCMLCGFGCHHDNRFLTLKETHPNMYNLLDIIKNNEYTYRNAIQWINEHGNMNIKL